MKRFIGQIIIFLIPIIILLSGMEYLLRKIPSTYQLKAQYLKKNREKIKILCLGNSAGTYGFDPSCFSNYTFNAAQVSQSLDLDYAILKQNIEYLDSLEYVILNISYPSLFFKLDKSWEKWRLPYYSYYGIHTGYQISKKPLLLQNSMQGNIKRLQMYYIDKDDPSIKIDEQGKITMGYANDIDALKIKAKEVAQRHTAKRLDMDILEENIKCIAEIIDMGSSKNVKTILVTLPAHEEYKKLLFKKQLELIEKIMNEFAKNDGVYYIDMNKFSSDYGISDFFDGNHLSYIGAKKASIQIDSIIRKIDKKRVVH